MSHFVQAIKTKSIVKKYKELGNIYAVADYFEISPSTVSKRLRGAGQQPQTGYKRKPKSAPAREMILREAKRRKFTDCVEIAARCGVHPEYALKVMRKHGVYKQLPKVSKRDMIIEFYLKNQEMTVKAIATAVGASPSYASAVILDFKGRE